MSPQMWKWLNRAEVQGSENSLIPSWKLASLVKHDQRNKLKLVPIVI